jgi:hypothetical protein
LATNFSPSSLSSLRFLDHVAMVNRVVRDLYFRLCFFFVWICQGFFGVL